MPDLWSRNARRIPRERCGYCMDIAGRNNKEAKEYERGVTAEQK